MDHLPPLDPAPNHDGEASPARRLLPADRTAMALSATAVALFVVAGAVAAFLAPREAWLLVLPCAALAVPVALQAATVDPDELRWALLLVMVPIFVLASDGRAPVVVVALGLALFAACEIMALRWRLAPTIPGTAPLLQQLGDAARLTLFGALGAGFVLGVSALALPGTTLLVGMAALALAAAGAMVFASGKASGR